MCHRKRLLIGSVVLLGWFFGMGPGSADAQEGRSRSDRSARMLERHPEADTDGDGQLSKEEKRAFFQAKPDQGGEGWGNRQGRWQSRGRYGSLDPAEMLKRHPELDTDKDGVLSEEEMRTARKRFGRFGPGGGPFQPHPEFFDWLIEHFAKADLDGNKQLSKEEILKLKEQYALQHRGPGFGDPGFGDPAQRAERLLKRHPEADTDGDGKLSEAEAQAFREKHPPRGKKRSSRGRRKHSRKHGTSENTDTQTE